GGGGGACRVRRRGRGRGSGRRRPGHLPRAALRRARRARPGHARRAGEHVRAVTTLAELGEFGLLAELERRGLAEGIEHDATVVDGLVVTQDALVEGVHFRFDLLGWRELGARAAAVNVSDLAASGAEPRALLVSLGLPPETELEDVLELYAGLNERGAPVRGGDTTRSDSVVLSVTALGRAGRVPGRAGASAGDLVVLTGPLGAAGAAFREGRLAPVPDRVGEGKRLASVATAML